MITPDHAPSQREDWATPPDVFEEIERRWGPFDLDPCATEATAKAPNWFCLPFTHPDRNRWDGLIRPWFGRVFMNPPYGKKILPPWIRKAHDEAHRPGVVVVGLLPARTDTIWFHEHVLGRAYVEFRKGRIKFGDSKNGAPFPSMIVVWGHEDASIREIKSY